MVVCKGPQVVHHADYEHHGSHDANANQRPHREGRPPGGEGAGWSVVVVGCTAGAGALLAAQGATAAAHGAQFVDGIARFKESLLLLLVRHGGTVFDGEKKK